MRVTAEKYLSLQEVGDELGVSDQTVRRWVKAGELAAYKPGKEYRIKGSDLEEFLQTREVGPKAAATSSPEAHDEDGRHLRYLRTLELFATSMESRWTAKVKRDIFNEKEFEDGVATLQNFENAFISSIGGLSTVLRAYEGSLPEDYPETRTAELRAYASTLPESELEKLINAKNALDVWHRTMWRAYDTLRARDAADIAQLDDYRNRLQAMERGFLKTTEQAASG